MRKEILIGMFTGIVATVFGLYFYLEFASEYSLEETLKILDEGNLYGKVLGLAAIPNLLVFFIFLKKKQELRARGVLLATFLIAFLILITQFL